MTSPSLPARPCGVRRSRRGRAFVAAGLIAALLALPACSRVAAPGPTTPTARGTGSVTGDWTAVGLFADAVLADDLAAAEAYVVPGSPAARYLRFQSDFAAADPARRKPSPGTWAVNVDRHLGEVTLGVGGGTPVTWTDWRFAPDGRILQWSTPTLGALETRLWTAESSATTPAGTVTLASALVNDTSLNVVLEVTSAAGTQTPDCGATYEAPAASPTAAAAPAASAAPGPATGRPADGCFGTERIAVGTSGRIALQFLDARLGGTVVYTLTDAAGATTQARLTVR